LQCSKRIVKLTEVRLGGVRLEELRLG
jgi:hypothetical protein